MTAGRLAALSALLLAHAAIAAAPGAVKGRVTSEGSRATPVANAVVTIDGPASPASPEALHAVMDQREGTFIPHVLAVVVGTTVDFPNHDRTLHNVFSGSSAKKFDLGMYGEGETRSVTFDKPGVVRIGCNAHPAMGAFVVVHSSPLVAVTDATGSYTIEGVPAGSHRLRVWHESLAEREAPVVVHEGQTEHLDMRLQSPR
jgi:plastocyanin